MPAEPTRGGPTGSQFWEKSRLGWHLTMYGVLAVTAVPALVSADVLSLATGALLAVAYAVLGAPALRTGSVRTGTAYLALAYAAFAVLALRDGTGFALLFVLYPQTFAILEREPVALGFVGLLSTLMGLAIGLGSDDWLGASVAALVNFGVAALLGLWISGVFRESQQRACLIAELEAARSELAEAHHREGVLAERERLSQEIHDTLAQGFTSIVMLARVAVRALAEDRPDLAAERLTAMESVARENLTEARALVAALAPPDLQASPLPEALDRIVGRFGGESGIAAHYAVLGAARPLPPHAEVALLRAAQEALTNVGRHSGARRVDVRLRFGPQTTSLEVCDDGRGFDAAAAGDGFGLRGMRSRLESVGGALTLDTSRGGGTRVSVEV